MVDFSIIIFQIVTTLSLNPHVLIFLICPLCLTIYFECKWRSFSSRDTIFSTVSALLLVSGVFIASLGVGLSSPVFNATSNTTNSFSTIIFFNDQNLSISDNTENSQFFNGTSISNVSILNISTTLESKPISLNFEMLGLYIGLISLGLSIIFSAVSFIITIDRDYPPAKFSNKQYLKLTSIWLIFGLMILLYGEKLSDIISFVTIAFGILYIVLGGILSIIFVILIQFERDFSQKIEKAIFDIKYPPSSVLSTIARSCGGIIMIWGVLITSLGVWVLQKTKKFDDHTEKIVKEITQRYFPR